MAGRDALEPGELGSVAIEQVGPRFRGRARTRDAGGTLRRLSATADTAEEAAIQLRRRADALAFTVNRITANSTVGHLLERWLDEARGRVKHQTHRVYADTIRWLVPMVGALRPTDLDAQRLREVLNVIRTTRSSSAENHARVALKGALALAVEVGVVGFNPLIGLRRNKERRAMPIALNVDQVAALRAAIHRREEQIRHNAGPTAGNLRWAFEVQIGLGLRLGEVLGLRNMDVDFGSGRVSVNGTLVDDVGWQVVRQAELKSRDQARIIQAPRFVLAALAEARAVRDSVTGRLPNAPALQSRAGTWIAPRNLRRAFRELRDDPELVDALEATGIEPRALTHHVLRRTAATLLAKHDGNLRGAQDMLGHSDIRTTRDSYAGEAYRVVGDATVLDEILGDGNAA
ncbi:site-specific integrase [Microbacterium ureisolvens]|uniref:Tyrosine-type recombinase/integrase n=1 Tax=Microbacterium ureisolvens TaxID=2781186 RepID=A0ABS7I113_9MICO|nr:tyrosine-type recombinase/integrase [Microbacterium ureisolvens]MBW9110173.1 tyrosine-type recombinase/integrase [Microbacterium ureisolvens]